MLLSTTTGPVARVYGEQKALEMIKTAGFDAYDLMLGKNDDEFIDIFAGDNYVAVAKEMRAYADSIGLVCNQCHSPERTSTMDPKETEDRFQNVVRSLEIASILGAKIVVVHPNQHITYRENVQKLFEQNMRFYTRLIPYCEKWNVKIGVENMWHYNKAAGRIMHSTCATPAEFLGYLETINSPWIVACLDLGHTELVDESNPYMIRTLGHKYLKALHVHDNDLYNDNHTLPYNGKIDWNAIYDALAGIEYEGDLTYEVCSFFTQFPQELWQDVLTFMVKVGRHMITQIQNRK